MITMTREEMIEKAKETRQTAPRPPVSQAELDYFPADVKTVQVKTRAGSTQVHVGRPIHQIQGGPLIINLHGGGFIKEWTRNDELFCRQILNRVGGCTPPEVAELYNLYYCDREAQKDLLVSPVFAGPEQLRGFPAALVITAENDTLCVEGEEFALHLAQAGTEVTVKRILGVTHGFVIRRQPGYLEVLNLMESKIREKHQNKQRKLYYRGKQL